MMKINYSLLFTDPDNFCRLYHDHLHERYLYYSDVLGPPEEDETWDDIHNQIACFMLAEMIENVLRISYEEALLKTHEHVEAFNTLYVCVVLFSLEDKGLVKYLADEGKWYAELPPDKS